MNVVMNIIEWGAQGEQVRGETFSIRAHKEPVLPAHFEQMRDGVWQAARRGEASLTVVTWRATEAANGS